MALFTVAGVSNNNGNVKVRFCSDLVLRVKNLQKQGDTDIQLVELPSAMNKVDTCLYLLTLPEFKPFYFDIETVLGTKQLPKSAKDIIIEVNKVEVDSEIEDMKELLLA